ncbi:MAG TPA: PIN domain-containing protein [Terriglobales bacterium]
MRTHVLDASALYRFISKGDGSHIVDDLLKQAVVVDMPILMSAVNWGEVYYSLVKHVGMVKTDNMLAAMLARVPISLVSVTPEDAVRAARLKAQFKLPYADAFAAALTGNQRVLVTADIEHFERVPKLRLLKLPRAKKV